MTFHRLILIACLIAASAKAEMTGQQRAQTAGRNLIGTNAPALVLKTIDGETIDLGSLYGKKAVYLKFWATWCVPCRQQMPHFQHTFEHQGSDAVVIAINVGFNDSADEILKYRRKVGISMPIVFDDDGHLAAAFNVRVTPQHIVIGRDGRINYVGHLADDALDAALASARAQPVAEPRPNGTPHGSAVRGADAAMHFVAGDTVPDVAAQTLDGKTFHLVTPGVARPTVLVFLSPWCESYLAKSRPQVSANCRTAREQVAALSSVGRTHWLGVASGLWAAPEDLEKYRRDYKVTLPLTLDESGELFRKFGVSDTPTIVVLDEHRTIVRRIDAGDIGTLPEVLGRLSMLNQSQNYFPPTRPTH